MRRPTALLLACLGASSARAAPRAFAQTYEARTGAEGDAQIESWVDDNAASGYWDVWRLWWGGTTSLTDTVELSAYVVAAQQWTGSSEASLVSGEGQPSSGLQLEMLYLMMSRWRVFGDGVHGFSLMGQLEFCQPMLPALADQQKFPLLSHATVLGERLVASYDTAHLLASANLLLDEAAVFDGVGHVMLGPDYALHAALKWTAGVAWAPWEGAGRGPPFTLGIEALGDVAPADFNYAGAWALWWPGAAPIAAGPALSFARGRFWATASFGMTPFAVEGFGLNGDLLVPTGRTFETVGRLIVAWEF